MVSLAGCSSTTNGGMPTTDMAKGPTAACQSLQRGQWQPINTPGFDPAAADFTAHSVVADVGQPGRIYLGTNTQGMFRSDDCGATFTDLTTGALGSQLRLGRQWTILVDPVETNVLYTNSGYGTNQYYKSVNGGVDWALLVPGGETGAFESNGFVQGMTMDPTDHRHLLLNPHFKCVPHAFNGQPNQEACLLESLDAGSTWHFLEGANTPTSGEGYGLWMEDRQLWYFAMDFGGLARTTDGGAHWTQLFQMSYATPAHTRGTDGALYLGNHFGLIRSVDGITFDSVQGAPGVDVLVTQASVVVAGKGPNFAIGQTSDLHSWEMLPSLTTVVPDPNYVIIFGATYDPVNRIVYAALSRNGFWRYALP